MSLGFLSGTFQKDWVSAIEHDEIPGYVHINVTSLNCKYSHKLHMNSKYHI